jgi:hypothetical protein
MWIRRILATLMAMLMLAHPALADIIMLRDGVKFVGSVVDRESVRADPSSYERIGFIPDGSEEEMRFPASEVEYVLFQDGSDGQLVEFTEEPAPYDPAPYTTVSGSVGSKGRVAWIVATGLVVAGIGVLIKIGGESRMSSYGEPGWGREGHGALGYTLIGIGSAILIGGVAKGLSGSRPANVSGNGLMLGCGEISGQRSMAVAYRVNF